MSRLASALPEAANDAQADHERLFAQGVRLEQLLTDIESSVGPTAWPKVEALIGSLLELHGAGFERLLEYTRDRPKPEELGERIGADALLSSLLALHGLHLVAGSTRVTIDKKRAEDGAGFSTRGGR